MVLYCIKYHCIIDCCLVKQVALVTIKGTTILVPYLYHKSVDEITDTWSWKELQWQGMDERVPE